MALSLILTAKKIGIGVSRRDTGIWKTAAGVGTPSLVLLGDRNVRGRVTTNSPETALLFLSYLLPMKPSDSAWSLCLPVGDEDLLPKTYKEKGPEGSPMFLSIQRAMPRGLRPSSLS